MIIPFSYTHWSRAYSNAVIVEMYLNISFSLDWDFLEAGVKLYQFFPPLSLEVYGTKNFWKAQAIEWL